ncbi:MAG: metal-dependent hydrolase [Candidatus Bathyarchaeia archaeon]
MELTTHVVFAFAVGLIFFGRADAALLVCLGAFVPDLDREYWFVRAKKYRDEQPHRARFHNVFVMAAGFLLSPFFSLGIFMHALQDSFTTAKDRGCEWFYPLTRWVKRGTIDADGNPQLPIENGKVYFFQEDPRGIIEQADPDLRLPGDQPTPWRRIYGPALNSHLLDRGFLLGAIFLSIIWLLVPNGSNLEVFAKPWSFYYPFVAGFAFFGLVYWSGELDRRDRKEPLKIIPQTMIKHRNIWKKPLFVAGLVCLGIWLVLYRMGIWANLEAVSANWIPIVIGTTTMALLSLVLIKLEQRTNKQKNKPVII